MSVDSTSTLDFITLGLAILGVGLAALSLGWQAATFYLSGSRVRVTMHRGALRREFGATTRMTGPVTASDRDIERMREQGFDHDVVVAIVRNRGRLAVSVDGVTATSRDGWGFARLADPENPSLPFRLEPGAKETWHVDLEPLQMLADGDNESREVFMLVELGTGKVARSKESLTIVPRSPHGTT